MNEQLAQSEAGDNGTAAVDLQPTIPRFDHLASRLLEKDIPTAYTKRPMETAKPRPRLLLVDDVPTNLRALTELLKECYELQIATSGRDALTLLQIPPLPDLILLDIMMPDMDGYAVCREIKRRPTVQHIPVIFLTALNDSDNEIRGLEAGAADYIVKPYQPDVTQARIRNHLAQKFATDQLRAQQATSTRSATNLFHQRDNIWEIIFQGHPVFHLKDMIGLSYLHYLLGHPNRYLSVEELVFLVSPRERAQIIDSAAEWIDADSLSFYRQLAQHVMTEDVAANPADRIQIASTETENLLGELRRIGVLGNDIPSSIDNRERYRKSVGNAIRRTLQEISIHDPALASHLQHPVLRLGYEVIYAPVPDVIWAD